jgi:hypothetical protein
MENGSWTSVQVAVFSALLLAASARQFTRSTTTRIQLHVQRSFAVVIFRLMVNGEWKKARCWTVITSVRWASSTLFIPGESYITRARCGPLSTMRVYQSPWGASCLLRFTTTQAARADVGYGSKRHITTCPVFFEYPLHFWYLRLMKRSIESPRY